MFGAILTFIIALEFKRSLLVSTERQQSVVQVCIVNPDRAARYRPKVTDP
jgi:hypothetical protein